MLAPELVESYRNDPESVYHTWFLGEERLRFFRVTQRRTMAQKIRQ